MEVSNACRKQAELIREVDRQFLLAMDEAGRRADPDPLPPLIVETAPHDPEWREKMQARLKARMQASLTSLQTDIPSAQKGRGMDPSTETDIMALKPEEILGDPQNPKCLGHYMERGNYTDEEGDWWAHYCGSAVCPRVRDCYAKTHAKGADHAVQQDQDRT